MREPTYRRKLNEKQQNVLELLYRFRFLTVDLLQRLEDGKSRTAAYSRLRILAEQGYVGRDYTPTRQIKGEFAPYFILRPGITALKNRLGDAFSPKAANNLRKDGIATEQFREHYFSLLRFFLSLRDLHPEVDLYTRNELTNDKYSYYPKPLPDAYATTGKSHFFVDVFEPTTMFFKYTRRVLEYKKYYESGAWEATGTKFPSIVFICGRAADQKRLQKKLPFMSGDLRFYTIRSDQVEALLANDKPFGSVDGGVTTGEMMAASVL